MKTIFCGTPPLAVPFLEVLSKRTSVQAVVTTPDQPAGRGYAVRATAVKTAALNAHLPVHQPTSLKETSTAALFKSFGAQLGIVVAYGKLLPKTVLETLPLGFLNVHFSLLPKYRGAAPIQWALLNGETETGVSLFWLDEGMDTGPLLVQKKLAISPDEEADALRNKLVQLGVQALEEALTLIDMGKIIRTPQEGAPSMAPLLKKEDGRIDWSKPASATFNQWRGLTPWPGLFCEGLKVLRLRVVDEEKKGDPGTVTSLVSGEGPVVRCGRGSLQLLDVQPDGKKAMPAWSWWQGARLKIGDRIG